MVWESTNVGFDPPLQTSFQLLGIHAHAKAENETDGVNDQVSDFIFPCLSCEIERKAQLKKFPPDGEENEDGPTLQEKTP